MDSGSYQLSQYRPFSTAGIMDYIRRIVDDELYELLPGLPRCLD